MTTTVKLGLDKLAAGQAQPEVLVNRSEDRLDQLVQLNVIAIATAPGSPVSNGDAYIVDDGGTGDFAGQDGKVAYYFAGWYFVQPANGWLAYVHGDGFFWYNAETSPAAWTAFSGGGGGAAADVTFDGSGWPLGSPEPDDVQEAIDDLATAVDSISVVPSNITPDTHPSSPANADDEFEYGAGLDTTGARRASATSWTWANQGAATAAVAQGALTMTCANSTTGIHLATQPVSGNFKYRAKCRAFFGANNIGSLGIALGKSGKYIILAISFNAGGYFFTQKWTNATTLSSSSFGTAGDLPAARTNGTGTGVVTDPAYLEVEYNGTNVSFRCSGSGYDGSFGTFLTETAATFLGGAPDVVGLWVGASASSTQSAMFDWFRKMS